MCNRGREESRFQQTAVKNKIVKAPIKETWENIIDNLIGNVDIADELDDALEKEKCEVKLQTQACKSIGMGYHVK